MFEVKLRDLGGRVGKLTTPHGALETPFLFPVVDPVRQTPSLERIRSVGFNGVITNAYLLYKRKGGLAKSVHSELSWTGVIMTDSGGYQVLVYGDIDVDNKTIVTFEKHIKSDIAVILDVPTGSKMSFEKAYTAVHETYRRGIEALPLIMDSEQLWVFPVQGAPYRELVVRAAILGSRLPYDVYAIGSPTVMLEKYRYSKLVELVILARMHIPPSKPLHVFGVGHPMIIPFLVAAGGDLFDSASYILYARDGRYMLETGTRDLRELSYFPCNCPVCSKYTPREVLELPSGEREEVIATHNLYMLMKEIKTVKEAMKEGRLWELLEYRSRGHPTLLEAFSVIKRYLRFLERTAPTTSPGGKALYVFDSGSLVNPRLRLNTQRVFSSVLENLRGKTVVLVPAHRKPYTLQEEYKTLRDLIGEREDIVVLFVHPFLGIFPASVVSTYPYYQHECRILVNHVNPSSLRKTVENVLRYGARKVILIRSGWLTERLSTVLRKRVFARNAQVIICKLSESSSQLLQ